MTMTFSSAASNQLDFDRTLAAISTATSRSRSTRPNRTTRKRSMLDDARTTYSMMNRENLLALMQATTISRLLGKYTSPAASGEPADEPSPRSSPLSPAADGEGDVDSESSPDATAELAAAPEEGADSRSAAALDSHTHRQGTPATVAAGAADDQWQLDCKYTLSEVQQHCQLDDCWMVIFDKVYNITDFVHEHPGGDFILFEYAGRDATHPFLSSRHGSSAYKMLDKYWIGILVDEELYYSNNSSYCSVYLDLSWRSAPTLTESAGGNSGGQLTAAAAATQASAARSSSSRSSLTSGEDDEGE